MSKQYLGDGVYGEFEGDHQIKLTAEDGVRTTDTVYLDSTVFSALLRLAGTEWRVKFDNADDEVSDD